MSEHMISSTGKTSGEKLLHRLRKNLRAGWLRTFPQKSTRDRAIDLLVTLLVLKTRHLITEAAVYDGRDQDKNWTPDYRIFSNSKWSERELFMPCLQNALAMLPPDSPWVCVAIDDTKLYKTGKKIPYTSLQRDSTSSSAYHTNLRQAQRFLHTAVILPLYRDSPDLRARAIPVRFKLSPVLKKPGKKATAEQLDRYKEEKKTNNLSVDACQLIKETRHDIDRAGYRDKILVFLGDSSFCNRTTWPGVAQTERTKLLTRTRKDTALAMPAPQDSRKVYGDKFTPQQVRTDDKIPWQSTHSAYAGQIREIQFKRIDNVLWQNGAKQTPLTLFVLKPLPYRPAPNGPRYYRDPAYLLTDATDIPSGVAIQAYLDRWQIEVAHREFKHDLGAGQAQVWNEQSVLRLPAAIVAAYSMMHLSALELHGPRRTGDYLPLSAWRSDQARPSCRDIVNLLHCELQQERHAPDYRPPARRTRPPVPHRNRQASTLLNTAAQ